MLSIYKASAGSGKTYALTREYIRMLLSDRVCRDMRLPHSRILAVTFTKKSTAEMKERILKELYILAKDPKESSYISDYLSDKDIDLNQEEIQQRAQLLLVGILQDYNRFSVSTIDGFFQQIVRTFAMELGLSTTYDLALDQKEIVAQAVDDIFRKIRETKPEDADLTTWLVEYAQNNIEDNKYWNPIENIKKFSEELSKEKLLQQLEEIQEVFADKDKIRRYYADLKRIQQEVLENVKRLHENIKLKISNFNLEYINSNNITIRNKTPEELLVEGLNSSLIKVLDGTANFYKQKDSNKKNISRDILDAIQNQFETELLPILIELRQILDGNERKDYLTAKAILKKLYSLGVLQDVTTQIRSTNLQQGRLPISEINQLIYQVIDGQEAPFIYERIGQYYHHYMIDEFQDTSALQWQNFKPLIGETESKGHNNLIVGDVKQSIYRFRNSDWHLLTQVDKEFQHTEFAPGMDGNWRTAPEIVERNELVMQRYCEWLVNELKGKYPDYEEQLNELASIYSHKEMHQDAKKKHKGYFHMQFFEGAHFEEQALDALLKQIQGFEQEKIDLSRVTVLTRTSDEAELVAKHLIKHSYEVQSAQGLRIESHHAVQVILALLKLSIDGSDIHTTFLNRLLGDIEPYKALISEAQKYPLYTHVQKLIDGLELEKWEGATPYITAFQDKVYQFTQTKVADTKLFLEYWENKGKNANIPAPKTGSAINIMTIHSSKGLEFDIVIIPFFDWKLKNFHTDSVIWCAPKVEPFNVLPLVPVYPSSKELPNSHLAHDFILEELAVYTDFLNLTYVAITRPKYRLYLYGQLFKPSKKDSKPTNVGQLMSHLFTNEVDNELKYTSLKEGEEIPSIPAVEKNNDDGIQASTYISVPMDNKRLKLRSRSEDEFDASAPISMVDLGNLMHLWMSTIRTWEDAPSAMQKLINTGQVTETQSIEMQQQLDHLKELITKSQHNDWFEGGYETLTEQSIITPTGEVYRPDRVMIKEKHAIVIDYKFGNKESSKYIEQIQQYIQKLQEIGYTSEGYIVYNQLRKIKHILQ